MPSLAGAERKSIPGSRSKIERKKEKRNYRQQRVNYSGSLESINFLRFNHYESELSKVLQPCTESLVFHAQQSERV